MTLAGIDVSASGQGAAFDWAAWRGKISFAGVKISEGLDYVDPDARHNIAQARAEGLVVIGYHFLHANQGGAPQARFFTAAAKAAGLGAGCLTACDVEDGGLFGVAPQTADLVAAGFLGEAHTALKAWPLCYTETWLLPYLVHCGTAPLWDANPGGGPIAHLGPWKTISFEQVGQSGTDTDLFYGDSAALAKLAMPG